MSSKRTAHVHGADYETVDEDYFNHRQLRRGAASWVLLAGLGVAYVISGDFAGWNFGLAQGGWGGLALATAIVAAMYTAMVFSLAELSSMIPTAGGGYGFARRAFGPFVGFLTGTAILMEYAIAPAAVAVFIGAYCESLLGIGGWPVSLTFYAVFVGIHLYGVGEALKIMFAITAVAAIALIVFVVAIAPKFSVDNLIDIAPTEAAGASRVLPFGYIGIWAAIPYAIWFFIAIEGVPLAAEETRDPRRDLPRGMIAGLLVLAVFASLMLVFGPGGAGAAALTSAGDPLVAALDRAYGESTSIGRFINVVGLSGLVASFFSVIFAYSRQVFALSRAGYLPRCLSLTGKRRTPYLALLVPGTLGFLISLTGQGDLLILMVVFGATISYVLMMAAHIALRLREPDLERPFRTPGGIFTSGLALVLALGAVVAGLLVDPEVVLYAMLMYAVMIAYFLFYSRHHLVAQAPEEEFELIQQAAAELSGNDPRSVAH